jgi:hypothetical protein
MAKPKAKRTRARKPRAAAKPRTAIEDVAAAAMAAPLAVPTKPAEAPTARELLGLDPDRNDRALAAIERDSRARWSSGLALGLMVLIVAAAAIAMINPASRMAAQGLVDSIRDRVSAAIADIHLP